MVIRFDGNVQLHVDSFDGPGAGETKQRVMIGLQFESEGALTGRALLLTRMQAEHLAKLILIESGSKLVLRERSVGADVLDRIGRTK